LIPAGKQPQNLKQLANQLPMRYIHLFLTFLAFSMDVQAQDKPKLYTLQSPYERYNYGLATLRLTGAQPIGDFSTNYIDKFSLENYSLSLESVRQNKVSYGGELGYSFFNKRLPRELFSTEGQDISAVQTRTLSQYQLHGFVNYHFTNSNDRIRPYVHLSAGGGMVDYVLYYGTLADQKKKFQLGYGLGIGSKFLLKPDGPIGIDVRVKYNYTALKYDYVEKGISSLNASVGLFYRWW
jgi:hypothetical protein